MSPADQAARDIAIDPMRSVIVQAPAGSGKTGLLTLRFLRLLSRVESPEEVVAITFTRKAASEMRLRITQALRKASDNAQPDDPYQRQMLSLARSVLHLDRAKGWKLLSSPNRLRILTIDSLCASLVRQLPSASLQGGEARISDDPQALYQQAATTAIQYMLAESDMALSFSRLMNYMDFRVNRLQKLIADMLSQREQWIHVVMKYHTDEQALRQSLETARRHLVRHHLLQCVEAISELSEKEVVSLLGCARFAASNVQADNPVHACLDLQDIPDSNNETFQTWRGLACLLLTDTGSWRKTVNKRIGFPAPSGGSPQEEKLYTMKKQEMMGLLEGFVARENLRVVLSRMVQVPEYAYTESEWEILEILLRLLRVSLGCLRVVFQERKEVDFNEIGLSALKALGTDDRPSDLALALDYRISHLLVDEFQDTSVLQFELLERLTTGWQPEDGRTLFLVGDPMQSIYRFRQADVGLFLQARERGVGDIRLEFVQLQVNFRSDKGMVDWFNHAFSQCFPARNDMTRGAICYTASQSSNSDQEARGMPVSVYPWVAKCREEGLEIEAGKICDLVRSLRKQADIHSIAILVKSRSHLLEVIPHLRQEKIAFQAVEIEHLGQEPVVRDLVALTQALMHPAHRVAWLSVLRAPFVGLSLADLLVLTEAEQDDETVFHLIKRALQENRLSESARCRLQRCLPIFSAARDERGRLCTSELVERVWYQLGGPAVLQSDTDLESVEAYFRRLAVIEQSPFDVMDLPTLLEDLYASSNTSSGETLQLMTIHKSKGLEFDAVILPGLGHKPRAESSRLLYWSEYVNEWGHDFLLSPIRAAASRNDSALTGFIKDIERSRSDNETVRLLYVAATRARKRLHLFGQIPEKDGELDQPNSGSLLSHLWPVVADRFHEVWHDAALDQHATTTENDIREQQESPRRFRLSLDWMPPTLPAPLLQQARPEPQDIEFEWAGEEVRHVGTVIHRIFQYIGENSKGGQLTQECQRMAGVARIWLEGSGVPEHRMSWALTMVERALQNLQHDPIGQWIFSPEHEYAACEMAMTGVDQSGFIKHVVVDRTFVDQEGVRWVIDFKTGRHAGTDIDTFLDQEQDRYRIQLEGYANIFKKLEDRPICLGLYFPLLPGWRQWDYLPAGL